MDLRDWYHLLRAAARREDGQTMAEYGVLLALVTLAVVAALTALAIAISGKLDNVAGVITSPLPTP
jgi:Flp pilus assembly pilin Flp